MLVALIAYDKPGAQKLRTDNRAAHLDYLNASDNIVQAGPFLGEDGSMIGSLIVLDVEDIAAAQRWADDDPYGKAGLFADVRLIEWKKVIG